VARKGGDNSADIEKLGIQRHLGKNLGFGKCKKRNCAISKFSI